MTRDNLRQKSPRNFHSRSSLVASSYDRCCRRPRTPRPIQPLRMWTPRPSRPRLRPPAPPPVLGRLAERSIHRQLPPRGTPSSILVCAALELSLTSVWRPTSPSSSRRAPSLTSQSPRYAWIAPSHALTLMHSCSTTAGSFRRDGLARSRPRTEPESSPRRTPTRSRRRRTSLCWERTLPAPLCSTAPQIFVGR